MPVTNVNNPVGLPGSAGALVGPLQQAVAGLAGPPPGQLCLRPGRPVSSKQAAVAAIMEAAVHRCPRM
jgi:hypothetical protein